MPPGKAYTLVAWNEGVSLSLTCRRECLTAAAAEADFTPDEAPVVAPSRISSRRPCSLLSPSAPPDLRESTVRVTRGSRIAAAAKLDHVPLVEQFRTTRSQNFAMMARLSSPTLLKLKAAVDTDDPPTIGTPRLAISGELDASVLLVTSKKGRVLATIWQPPRTSDTALRTGQPEDASTGRERRAFNGTTASCI